MDEDLSKYWQSVREHTIWLHAYANRVLSGDRAAEEDAARAVNSCAQLYRTVEHCTLYRAKVNALSSPALSPLSLSPSPTSPLPTHSPTPPSPPETTTGADHQIPFVQVIPPTSLPESVPVVGNMRKRHRSLSSSACERPSRIMIAMENESSEDPPSPKSPMSVDGKDNSLKRKRRSRAPAPFCDNLFCHSCGETQTSEWRRGPDGFKSLCNACGLHYASIVKKEKLIPTSAKKVTLDMLLNTDSNGIEYSDKQLPSMTTLMP